MTYTNRNRDLAHDKRNELVMRNILNNQYDNVIIERVGNDHLVCCPGSIPKQAIQDQLRNIGCRFEDDVNCGFTIWLKMKQTKYGIQWYMGWIIQISIACFIVGIIRLIYHYYDLANLWS